LENIAYPLSSQGNKSWGMAVKLAEDTLDKVLLPLEKERVKTLWNSFPSQLSGGQRQRVALAQAMIHNPTVIFADEPTGQLDKRTRQQVMNVLKEWVEQEQEQRCLIWVTHHHVDDLDLMGIDELLFLENGECIKRDRNWLKEWA
jgi:putative ABC transport system ATP-binding protein